MRWCKTHTTLIEQRYHTTVDGGEFAFRCPWRSAACRIGPVPEELQAVRVGKVWIGRDGLPYQGEIVGR